MTYPEMIEADWLLRDDIQFISLATVAAIHAQRRPLNWREAQLGAAIGLETTDEIFVCSINELEGYIPKRGETLTDEDGVEWTIISVAQTNFAGVSVFYELACRMQYSEAA